MFIKAITKLFQPFAQEIITTQIRAPVLYPSYLSPNYQQIQYAAHYFNKAKMLQIVEPNSRQIHQDYLPKFLIEQVQKDKMDFIKTKQFIFIGRSNSGKSSLLNAVFNSKIARVSRTPGTTKFLHFHQAKLGADKLLLCDAPGYGFAKINKQKRAMWAGLIDEYLKISSRLSQIFICINFEHGIKDSDIQTLQKISKYNVNIQLILTKVDRVKQQRYLSQLKAINETVRRLKLPNINDRIIACSSRNKFGINYVKCRIVECLEKTKTRNIDGKQQLLIDYLKNVRIQPKHKALPEKTLSKPHVVRKLIYHSKLTKFLV